MSGRTKAKESKPVTLGPRKKDLGTGVVGVRLSLDKFDCLIRGEGADIL
jgi:hypothetical protein